MKKDSVLIVGGGIAGLCSALYLQQSGWQVTIIDKNDMNDNCSYGNAGMIVPSHFIPMAAPGMLAKGIRWMLDKKSPFYIKPSFNLFLFKWGLNFLRHSTAKHVSTTAPFIKDLNVLGGEEYSRLKNEFNLEFPLEHKGILMLYKTKKTEDEQIALAQMAHDFGLNCTVLDHAGIQELEPGLKMSVTGGVHYLSDGHIDPAAFMKSLIQSVEQAGATIIRNAAVDKIEIKDSKISKVFVGSKEYSADKFIFATGAELTGTLKHAKVNIPVMPGKGYSFMTHEFGNKLQHPALLLDDKVSITPMGGSVRIGGTMELAGINDKINMNKVTGIAESVNHYYADVKIETPSPKDVWYGFRPCSPDGLPYLGRLKSLDNAVIAGGGGMMGVSCGPAFGKIVSELINESQLSMDINCFDPERFN